MNNKLERISIAMTNWVGTPLSLVVHTILFAAMFGLRYLAVPLDDIFLILTTAVSLEAIYLAIFIQMTVNRHAEHLEAVGEDIEDIQEEVEDLGEDVEEISEDIEEIQKEQTEDETEESKSQAMLENIQAALQKLIADVEVIKEKNITGEIKPSENRSEATNHESHYFKRIMDFISLKSKSPEEIGELSEREKEPSATSS